jgi:hypothetical protein
VDPREDHR